MADDPRARDWRDRGDADSRYACACRNWGVCVSMLDEGTVSLLPQSETALRAPAPAKRGLAGRGHATNWRAYGSDVDVDRCL